MFENQIDIVKKPSTPHPLHKYMKWKYEPKLKTYHNSVRNPQYPKKELPAAANAAKMVFTVIGNCVTKEFIESCQLVNVLYTYRTKSFGRPVIRGLTQLEWLTAWAELKEKCGGYAFCIRKQVAILINDDFLGDDGDLKELMKTKYVYHVSLNYRKRGVEEFARYVKKSGRSCAYMHISIDDEYIGTFIFMLYTDLVPLTCENFLRLCNDRRGGYGGTPVHRIVRDGWIQCGGYGLKSAPLPCENYIVPHDKRGVLCMANNGRHCDNSTQFFVTLQPAEWMDHKYVAFGQLIDGNETLKKIEATPTRYESPMQRIVICKAGILNMEREELVPCRGAVEYIEQFVFNVTEFADAIINEVMEKVNLEIEFKTIAKMKCLAEDEDSDPNTMHATKRFFQRKTTIEKEPPTTDNDVLGSPSYHDRSSPYHNTPRSTATATATAAPSELSGVPPAPREHRREYFPLGDVPYPGECDSDLDLVKIQEKCLPLRSASSPHSATLSAEYVKKPTSSDEEELSLNSDEDREIQQYIRFNADRVSFAGGVVRAIARNMAETNLFSDMKSFSQQSRDALSLVEKKSEPTKLQKTVHISESKGDKRITKIRRRQTGFITSRMPEPDSDSESDERERAPPPPDASSAAQLHAVTDAKKSVRIASGMLRREPSYPGRRKTGFIKLSLADAAADARRPSVLARLMEDVCDDTEDGAGLTLKDYKPVLITPPRKSFFLTSSPQNRQSLNAPATELLLRDPNLAKRRSEETFDDILNLRHGPVLMRRYSSDYVHSRFMVDKATDRKLSIRTAEFAKRRPSLSVAEYKRRATTSQLARDARDSRERRSVGSRRDTSKTVETVMEAHHRNGEESSSSPSGVGLHLPGDTPTYSWMDLSEGDFGAANM